MGDELVGLENVRKVQSSDHSEWIVKVVLFGHAVKSKLISPSISSFFSFGFVFFVCLFFWFLFWNFFFFRSSPFLVF